MNNQELNPSNVMVMRISGGVILFFGFLQMAIAAAAYDNQPPTGCWWVGLFCMFTGVFGLISNNKSIVMTGCVFSVVALILAFVGMILDGVWSGEFNALATCYNPSNNRFYGNNDFDYEGYAKTCENQNFDTDYDCYCVMNNVDSDNNGDYDCYRFALYHGKTCDYLMTELPQILTASWVFILLIFFVLLTYSIFTCVEGCDCCKRNGGQQQFVDHNNQNIQYQGQAQAQPTVVVAAAPIPGQAVAVSIAPQAQAVPTQYAHAYPNQQGGYGQQQQQTGSINKANYM